MSEPVIDRDAVVSMEVSDRLFGDLVRERYFRRFARERLRGKLRNMGAEGRILWRVDVVRDWPSGRRTLRLWAIAGPNAVRLARGLHRSRIGA